MKGADKTPSLTEPQLYTRLPTLASGLNQNIRLKRLFSIDMGELAAI